MYSIQNQLHLESGKFAGYKVTHMWLIKYGFTSLFVCKGRESCDAKVRVNVIKVSESINLHHVVSTCSWASVLPFDILLPFVALLQLQHALAVSFGQLI